MIELMPKINIYLNKNQESLDLIDKTIQQLFVSKMIPKIFEEVKTGNISPDQIKAVTEETYKSFYEFVIVRLLEVLNESNNCSCLQ